MALDDRQMFGNGRVSGLFGAQLIQRLDDAGHRGGIKGMPAGVGTRNVLGCGAWRLTERPYDRKRPFAASDVVRRDFAGRVERAPNTQNIVPYLERQSIRAPQFAIVRNLAVIARPAQRAEFGRRTEQRSCFCRDHPVIFGKVDMRRALECQVQ